MGTYQHIHQIRWDDQLKCGTQTISRELKIKRNHVVVSSIIPSFPLLKLPQINPNKKDRIGGALPVFYGWALLDS
jgi:hypothetical protein